MSDAGEAGVIVSQIELESGRPLRAMIEISDRCNEVCVHCYQEQGQKGEMSTEQIKAVIDELAARQVLVLTIAGGEATLRPDFLELCAHARARGFLLRIFTNGLRMTAELARALADLAVDVVEISVYSHRADVHDFVTGVPGSFEKTVAGIRHLVAAGVSVHIKTMLLNVNEGETDAYVELAQQLGVTFAIDPTQLLPTEVPGRSPELWNRSREAYARVNRDPQFGNMVANAFGQAVLPPSAQDSTLCGVGDTYHVEPNGELRPCTMLAVGFGNVATDGVEALERDHAAFHALRALRLRDVHGCRDCDLSGYCGRCHAASLAEVGDALAPYASACERARDDYALAVGVAPEIRAAQGRDPLLGPYVRSGGEHTFEAVADVITPHDEALAARLGWSRTAPRAQAQPARPGQLVQLRRPGSKRASTVRVPQHTLPPDAPIGSAVSDSHVVRS